MTKYQIHVKLILTLFLTLCSFNVFSQSFYSFKVTIDATITDTIIVEDLNSVSTGLIEGSFSFGSLLSNDNSGVSHSMSESPQFPQVSFTLQLPTGYEKLGCHISFIENSPSSLYAYKRNNRFTLSFSQGYSAFHGTYKVICH